MAVAKSLTNDPARWEIVGDGKFLKHDSGIYLECWDGMIVEPFCDDPDANAEIIKAALDAWIVARLRLPASLPEPPRGDA